MCVNGLDEGFVWTDAGMCQGWETGQVGTIKYDITNDLDEDVVRVYGYAGWEGVETVHVVPPPRPPACPVLSMSSCPYFQKLILTLFRFQNDLPEYSLSHNDKYMS